MGERSRFRQYAQHLVVDQKYRYQSKVPDNVLEQIGMVSEDLDEVFAVIAETIGAEKFQVIIIFDIEKLQESIC